MKGIGLLLVAVLLIGIGAVACGSGGDGDGGDSTYTPSPAPAAFSISNLSIEPAEVLPDETVTISVSVANTGGNQGSHSVVLNINGAQEETQSVTIAASASDTVTFSVTKQEGGLYTVAVDGLTGSFTVMKQVTFPDMNLEAAIREAINKPQGPIYTSDLESLTTMPLEAEARDISDLTGLEYCINLQLINLWDNNISDLSPLAGLTNLRMLAVPGNNISDLSPLAGLTNLEDLYLARNNISDLSPLVGLTNLERLSLWENNISDISPLVENSGLSAGDYVDLRNNPLSITSVNIYIPQLEARGVSVQQAPEEPSTNEFTSDDGRITFVLDNVVRTKVWPAEISGGRTPKAGYDFAVVYVTIVSITDGHVTVGGSDSTIIDGNGVEYKNIYWIWEGLKLYDPTDFSSAYELIEGSQATLIFELPENVIPVKVKLNYLFFSSWSPSGQYVSEEERYIDIILP